MKKLLFVLCLAIVVNGLVAQEVELEKPEYKNTIRWNPTPMMFNVSNITLGYERILKNNKSFSVNIGFFKLPELLPENGEYLSLEKKGGKLGFTVTGDYRFYLKKYNKKSPPAGVYIGPYFSYYRYSFDNKILINDNGDISTGIGLDASFGMTSLGFELGYQFVFWDRLSLDLILVGPSLSYYNGNISVETNIELDKESETYQRLHDLILDKYPWLETFIELDAINSGGKFDATGIGFRYVIQIGYRF